MAKTIEGMQEDSKEYDNILYVSEERLHALRKGKVADQSKKSLMDLMYPIDLPDDAALVPIDITGAIDEFEGAEELIGKLGVKKTAEALVKAAKLFETTSKENFNPNNRPIPMTVGEWKEELPLDEDEDDDEDEDEDDAEGADEEEGEEEDEEGDEETEPPAKKTKSA